MLTVQQNWSEAHYFIQLWEWCHYECTSQGQIINQHFYLQVLRHLCDTLHHKQPQTIWWVTKSPLQCTCPLSNLCCNDISVPAFENSKVKYLMICKHPNTMQWSIWGFKKLYLRGAFSTGRNSETSVYIMKEFTLKGMNPPSVLITVS